MNTSNRGKRWRKLRIRPKPFKIRLRSSNWSLKKKTLCSGLPSLSSQRCSEISRLLNLNRSSKLALTRGSKINLSPQREEAVVKSMGWRQHPFLNRKSLLQKNHSHQCEMFQQNLRLNWYHPFQNQVFLPTKTPRPRHSASLLLKQVLVNQLIPQQIWLHLKKLCRATTRRPTLTLKKIASLYPPKKTSLKNNLNKAWMSLHHRISLRCRTKNE